MGKIAFKVDVFRTIFAFWQKSLDFCVVFEYFLWLLAHVHFFTTMGSALALPGRPRGAPGRAPGRPGVLLDAF